MSALRLAWLGDDFTGASDTLATLAQAGLRARLFLGVPDAPALAASGPLDAVGIAGAARSLAPAAMRDALEPAVRFLAGCGAPVLHYKVCSTFDSAPGVGSIGAAVRMFREAGVAGPALVVGGQPSLGRYCAFGQLFASVSPGGAVVRIDRHPTMSRHPVTPMDEADLRLHLGRQGLAPMALFDLRDHALRPDAARARWAEFEASAAQAVLVDVTDDAHLRTIGSWLWEPERVADRPPRLVVGASSVAQALVDTLGGSRVARRPALAPAAGPVFVLAGSLSPRTALQVANASSYERVTLEPGPLCTDDAYLARTVATIARLLGDGRHVLAHTPARDDGDEPVLGDLAPRCGRLLRGVLLAARHGGAGVTRIGVAGGDTSSHAVQALGPTALDWLAQVDNGVALCRAVSADAWLDGLELMLKGGQLGMPALFERLIGI